MTETSPTADSRPAKSTYTAVRWLLLGSVLQRLVSVLALAFIGRMLTKSGFGIYRELLSLHIIALALMPLALDQLVAREVNRREFYAGALQQASLLVAMVLGVCVLLLSPWLDDLLSMQSYPYLLWLMPIGFLLQAVKLPHRAMLGARLDFRSVATAELVNSLISMPGAALLVWVWRSPTPLYLALMLGEATEWFMLRRAARQSLLPWKHEGSLKKAVKEHRNFMSVSTTDQVLNATSNNIPILVLGAALGAAEAGVFAMASSLVLMPLFLLTGAIARVALPSLAGRDELDLQRRGLEVLQAAAAFIAPVLLLISCLAHPIIALVLGQRWLGDTVVIVQLICGYCVLAAMFAPLVSLEVIRNRVDLGLKWNLVTLVLRLLALGWGVRFGLIPAVAAFSAASFIMWLVQGVLLAGLLGSGQRRFHTQWIIYLLPWGCMAGAVLAVVYLLPLPYLVQLLAGGVCLLFYLAAISRLHPESSIILYKLVKPLHSLPLAPYLFRLLALRAAPVKEGETL